MFTALPPLSLKPFTDPLAEARRQSKHGPPERWIKTYHLASPFQPRGIDFPN
jgi:hypothetical protein